MSSTSCGVFKIGTTFAPVDVTALITFRDDDDDDDDDRIDEVLMKAE